MHEMSLLNDLMGKIIGVARKEKAAKVVGLKLKLGALSHFSPEHFREHFEEASKGTVAEGARLTMEVSDDISDPNAQSIVLENVEIKK